jgi:hypothetical protein
MLRGPGRQQLQLRDGVQQRVAICFRRGFGFQRTRGCLRCALPYHSTFAVYGTSVTTTGGLTLLFR